MAQVLYSAQYLDMREKCSGDERCVLASRVRQVRVLPLQQQCLHISQISGLRRLRHRRDIKQAAQEQDSEYDTRDASGFERTGRDVLSTRNNTGTAESKISGTHRRASCRETAMRPRQTLDGGIPATNGSLHITFPLMSLFEGFRDEKLVEVTVFFANKRPGYFRTFFFMFSSFFVVVVVGCPCL